MTSPKGFPSDQKNLTGTGTTNNFTTVVPKDQYRHGLDSGADFVFKVGAAFPFIHTAEAGTGLETLNPQEIYNWVVETGTEARKGDLVKFIDGPLAGIEIPIIKAEANRFQIPIKDVALDTNTFYILRRGSPAIDEDGVVQTAQAAGARIIQYDLDGLATDVKEDTGTPADSRPLPTRLFDTGGAPLDPATFQKQEEIVTELQSIISELQASRVLMTNTAGELDQGVLVATTAQTVSPPAGAVGCNIQAPSTNTDNVRFIIGGQVASDVSGFLMEPGRSETFNTAADISFCATAAGTNEFIVQWILNA